MRPIFGFGNPAGPLFLPRMPMPSPLPHAQSAAVRDDGAVRWPLERIPLRVSLEPSPVGGPTTDSVFMMLAMALRQWEAASAGLIRFHPAMAAENASVSADILVQWADETTLGRDFEVGHTERTVQDGLIRQVMVTLITQPAIDRQLNAAQQRDRLFATLLHEIGHALGLEHSPNPEDGMYHRGWRHTRLSRNDIHRLGLLY